MKARVQMTLLQAKAHAAERKCAPYGGSPDVMLVLWTNRPVSRLARLGQHKAYAAWHEGRHGTGDGQGGNGWSGWQAV